MAHGVTYVSLQMVFFLVLDILWVVVCVAGVIVTLLIWFVYHVIRKVIEANCHLTDAGTCHCTGEADVPIKSTVAPLVSGQCPLKRGVHLWEVKNKKFKKKVKNVVFVCSWVHDLVSAYKRCPPTGGVH